MPWEMKDAPRFTKKAEGSPKRARAFAEVANKVLAESGNEGKAVRVANKVVGAMKAKQKRAATRAKKG